jgi:hypothetical protein
MMITVDTAGAVTCCQMSLLKATKGEVADLIESASLARGRL